MCTLLHESMVNPYTQHSSINLKYKFLLCFHFIFSPFNLIHSFNLLWMHTMIRLLMSLRLMVFPYTCLHIDLELNYPLFCLFELLIKEMKNKLNRTGCLACILSMAFLVAFFYIYHHHTAIVKILTFFHLFHCNFFF